MVEPWPVDGGLEWIAVQQQIEQDLENGGGDAPAAAGAEDNALGAAKAECWSHRGEHPFSRANGVGLALNQPVHVGVSG